MRTNIGLAAFAGIFVLFGCAGGPEQPEVKQLETPAVGEPPTEAHATMNLRQTLEEDGNFTTMLTAIQFADLQDMFEGTTSYTVFAPTDEAWAKMPQEQRERYFAAPEEMAALIRYHMAEGSVLADDLKQLMARHEEEQRIPTVHGARMPVTVGEGGTIMVAGARVSKADHSTTNGVIHHIELVLIPPADPRTRL